MTNLQHEGMYFVIVYTPDKIKLANLEIDVENGVPINISNASTGTICRINPIIEVSKNQTLKFDLSHSTLAFIQNSVTYSAFDLNLYSDSKYSNQFWTSKATSSFEVTKSGNPGVTTTAHLTLDLQDGVPDNLWYKFSLQNTDIIPQLKSEMIIDREAYGYTKINAVKSVYDGAQTVVGVGTTTFTYDL